MANYGLVIMCLFHRISEKLKHRWTNQTRLPAHGFHKQYLLHILMILSSSFWMLRFKMLSASSPNRWFQWSMNMKRYLWRWFFVIVISYSKNVNIIVGLLHFVGDCHPAHPGHQYSNSANRDRSGQFPRTPGLYHHWRWGWKTPGPKASKVRGWYLQMVVHKENISRLDFLYLDSSEETKKALLMWLEKSTAEKKFHSSILSDIAKISQWSWVKIWPFLQLYNLHLSFV